jgi:hypothetical protein
MYGILKASCNSRSGVRLGKLLYQCCGEPSFAGAAISFDGYLGYHNEATERLKAV